MKNILSFTILIITLVITLIVLTGCDKENTYNNNDIINLVENTVTNIIQDNDIVLNKTTEIDITIENEVNLTIQEQAVIKKGIEMFGQTYCEEGKCTCETHTSIMSFPTIETYNRCKLCDSEWRSGVSTSEYLCTECSDLTKRCKQCCKLLRKCGKCGKYIYYTHR